MHEPLAVEREDTVAPPTEEDGQHGNTVISLFWTCTLMLLCTITNNKYFYSKYLNCSVLECNRRYIMGDIFFKAFLFAKFVTHLDALSLLFVNLSN